jgi:hypothetical protein
MAQDKQSFLLYTDIVHTVHGLTDEEAGLLFKHILDYVNDKSPQASSRIVAIAFEPIKQSLKRDLEKYERIRNRNALNGSKGGRPSEKPKKTQRNPKNPTKPQKAVLVIDSVSDSDIVIDNDIEKEKGDLEKELDKFYKFRKEMKKPILESSKQPFLDKLYKLSNQNETTAIEVLRQSIANGWQGIFPLKQNNNEQRNSKDHPLQNLRNLSNKILGSD